MLVELKVKGMEESTKLWTGGHKRWAPSSLSNTASQCACGDITPPPGTPFSSLGKDGGDHRCVFMRLSCDTKSNGCEKALHVYNDLKMARQGPQRAVSDEDTAAMVVDNWLARRLVSLQMLSAHAGFPSLPACSRPPPACLSQ